jgi:hypothetical protein
MTDEPAFCWRREALPILFAITTAAVVRAIPLLAIGRDGMIDSDNALGMLMAQAIATEGWRPLMYSGQHYLGAGEAYLMAPLVAWLGPAAGATLTLYGLSVSIVPVLYRLLHLVGGRPAALAGSLLWASGTPTWARLAISAPAGYLSNFALGLLLLLQARHVAHWRGQLVVGLLAGLGWWNNPQILPYLLTAAALIGRSGAIAAALEHGQLLRQLLRSWAGRAALAMTALGLLAAAITLWATHAGDGPYALGPLTLRRPATYLPKTLALACAGVLLAELALQSNLRALLRGSLIVGSGALLGITPWLAYQIDPPRGIKPHLQYRIDHIHDNLQRLNPLANDLLWGDGPAAAVLPWLAVGMLAAWLIAVFNANERARLAGLLLLPSGATYALLVLRGGLQWHRYLLPLPFAAAVLLAWSSHMLWNSHWRTPLTRRLALLLIATPLLLHAQQQLTHYQQISALVARPCPAQQVLALLRAATFRHGRGQYWVAFHLSALSAGSPRIALDYDGAGNYDRFPWFAAQVAAAAARGETLARVYDAGGVAWEDPALVRELLSGLPYGRDDEGAGRLLVRWSLRGQHLARPGQLATGPLRPRYTIFAWEPSRTRGASVHAVSNPSMSK